MAVQDIEPDPAAREALTSADWGYASARRCRSCRRELTPSLENTLCRWYSAVRGLMKSWAPISGFAWPSAASRATAMCDVALAGPLNNTIEIAGPEPLRFEDFVRRVLRWGGDQRVVVADPQARYFGARLGERTLLPGDGAQLGPTRFGDWLSKQAPAR
jgi:hypothetical protein